MWVKLRRRCDDEGANGCFSYPENGLIEIWWEGKRYPVRKGSRLYEFFWAYQLNASYEDETHDMHGNDSAPECEFYLPSLLNGNPDPSIRYEGVTYGNKWEVIPKEKYLEIAGFGEF